MSGVTVQVESKIVAGNPHLTKLDTVLVKLPRMRITVEDLIRRTVEEQVWDLLSRRKVDEEEARRALERQYLTQDQIQEQASLGRIRMPQRKAKAPRINAEAEIRKALQAFAAGAYAVIVNRRQVTSLEEELSFGEMGKVTFLRLTPLAGG
jgi:hypothetical protein